MNALFQQGEAADHLLLDGQLGEARDAYRRVIDEAKLAEPIDGYVLSKCFLGLMILEAMAGRFDVVQQYANTELGDESTDFVQRLGVFMLKKGMVSKSDFAIFHNLRLFAGDVDKQEAIRHKLRTITLSPWVPPVQDVTVFDKGRAYETGRDVDGSIRNPKQ